MELLSGSRPPGVIANCKLKWVEHVPLAGVSCFLYTSELSSHQKLRVSFVLMTGKVEPVIWRNQRSVLIPRKCSLLHTECQTTPTAPRGGGGIFRPPKVFTWLDWNNCAVATCYPQIAAPESTLVASSTVRWMAAPPVTWWCNHWGSKLANVS